MGKEEAGDGVLESVVLLLKGCLLLCILARLILAVRCWSLLVVPNPPRCDPKCGQPGRFRTTDVDGELLVPHRLKAVSSLVPESDRLLAVLEIGAEADRSHVVSEFAVASDRLPTVLEKDAVFAKPVKLLERREGRPVGRCARVERVQRAEVGSTSRTCRVVTSSFVPSCDSLPTTRVKSPSSQRVNAALHDSSHTHKSRARMHDACHVVNSRNSEGDRSGRGRGGCGSGGTKVLSTSALSQVGCPAEEKIASLQQAPGKLHVETSAGRDESLDLRISQEVEIIPGFAVTVSNFSSLVNAPVLPGPDSTVRNMLG